jgi:superfamily II DNA or RNA helicase
MMLRPYQEKALDDLWEWFARTPDGNPIVGAAVGCHAKGQGVLLSDGRTVSVENVVVGDRLLGPDGIPRNVMSLCRGTGQMYQITPTKGSPFAVNDEHVLSLVKTPRKKGDKHTVFNMTVREFLAQPPWLQLDLKLYRASALEFDCVGGSIPLDPYFLGVFLGDGSCVMSAPVNGRPMTPNVTTADPEIETAVRDTAASLGLGVRRYCKPANAAATLSLRQEAWTCSTPNRLTTILKDLGLAGKTGRQKFIPDAYKRGTTETRRHVLAGLIDSDGSLSRGAYDFVSTSRRLSDDVAFVARSLGLAAYVCQCVKRCQTGAASICWRVSISGDCSGVPVRVPRKVAPNRTSKKSVLVTGFSCRPMGEGEFFGFCLDRDHLYLMDDFTVTHNSGKSVMMAALAQRSQREAPGTRVLVLVHQRELLDQNVAKMRALSPATSVGIYSAGHGRKDTTAQVTYATIGSVYKHAYKLGRIDLVMADECHLIPTKDQGMWRKFLRDLAMCNPHTRCIGWTGTPFRGNGVFLTAGDAPIFTHVAARVTMTDLLEQGYLAPLTSVRTDARIDSTGVATQGDDYVVSELAAKADKDDLVQETAEEICRLFADRSRWLVFAVTVQHAEHVRDALVARGVACECVTGDTPQAQRDAALAALRSGRLQCLVNVAVLTTGFDLPEIDAIALLRATKSPVLLIQICGRGMRKAPGKNDCLLADFTDTLERMGPIDQIKGRLPPSKGGPGEAPFRLCPQCGSRNKTAALHCADCGHEFPPPERIKHGTYARGAAALSAGVLTTVETNVTSVTYRLHSKPGSADSMRVDYFSGPERVASEWVLLSHPGYPRMKAERWWASRRTGPGIPIDSEAGVQSALSGGLKPPIRLTLKPGRYAEIVGCTFA